jgi:3-hydroxybutyryl-CoA dehydrogenase
MHDVNHVGLLGYGTMGAGVAHAIAASGRAVTVVDLDHDRLDAGHATVEAACPPGAVRDEILGRIVRSADIGQLAGVDLIVESVVEDVDIKKDLLRRVAAVVRPDVPLVTTTSGFSVTDIAAALPGPGRVAGMHFFHPAPTQRTVEVIRGVATTETVVEHLVAFVETLGDKEPIVVDDRPGFLISSLLIPYLNDVVQAFDEQLASAEDLDLALQLGLGYKTGPLEMLDQIGLDTHLRSTSALHAVTGDPRYNPPPLLQRMVAAGRLGAKNGTGFHVPDTRKDS